MPKLQLPPNIKKLKEQLETGHNLVDHFLVCGIPPSMCSQEFLYDYKNDKYKEIFKENAKPSIISKFPDFDNSIDSIDEEIINYCFPDGFQPIFSSSNRINGKIFSVILDNNLCSAEHPQKYLTCLLFYENLIKYQNLKSKLDGNKEISKIEELEEGDLEKKLEANNKVNSQEEKSEIIEIFNGEKENKNEINFKKLYSSVITNDNLNNIKTSMENNSNNIKRASFIVEKSHVFIPKCICLVSIHPYITSFHKILKVIFQYLSVDREIPLEKIITNLIIEVPIPPRGLYSINYTLMDKLNTLEGCQNNKIQITEVNLKNFNSSLDFKIKLEAIKHILLGSKILLFSEDLDKLFNSILSFLVLLFPFKYPFQVTSYLHKDNYCILESISPFMMGIKENYKKSFFDDNEIMVDGMNIFIIDLERKKSHLISNEKFPNFPSKILNTLEKDIKSLESKENKIKKKNDNSIIKEFNQQYQNLFFEFFCEILKGYEEFLNMDYFKSSDQDKVTSIETLFQCQKFIKTHSSSDIEFYNQFINDSQLFADFIYKRMIPRNNQEIIDVLLVNETNIKIKNKQKIFSAKENTDFLDSIAYQPNNKYVVPVPRPLTSEEKNVINSKKELLLGFGQEINNENGKLLFKYYLFPQLNFPIYCNNNNINDYYPPPDYSEEIEAINSDLISKSSIGQSINLSLEMKNNLYLTWLEMWAYTFWYVEKEERKFRFDNMLDVLDKVIHHEMNIFNLMFDVLNQENEQKMIVKLYQKILQLKVNPSTFIYNIISTRLDKEQIKDLFEQMKSGTHHSLKFNNRGGFPMSKRTFLTKLDKNSLVYNKLSFDTVFSCIDCNENINLFELCQDFNGIKNDILWAPCKNGHYNLPKIKVNFGLEFFPLPSKDNNITTSIKNEIVLHSPYNLKINIKHAVTSHYGLKLNVNEFKNNFSPLFWNFIYYCYIHKLNYDIILPYKKKVEQERNNRTIINPNNEKIKLIHDNELFKKNEKKKDEDELKLESEDSENSLLLLENCFKNLEKQRVISFEIQKAIKNKNKRLVSIVIDHIATKALSFSESEGKQLSKDSSKDVVQNMRSSCI